MSFQLRIAHLNILRFGINCPVQRHTVHLSFLVADDGNLVLKGHIFFNISLYKRLHCFQRILNLNEFRILARLNKNDGNLLRCFDLSKGVLVNIQSERASVFLAPKGHFGDEHGCHDRVLIACICAFEIAIAFFKAENISSFACFLWLFYFFADEFKARENLFHFNTVIITDCLCEVGGDNRLYHICVIGKLAARFEAWKNVFGKHRAHLIPGIGVVFAVFVFNDNSHTVRIGVCADNQIRAAFLCVFDCNGESLFVLGVGRFYGRKSSVGQLLLFYDNNIVKTHTL